MKQRTESVKSTNSDTWGQQHAPWQALLCHSLEAIPQPPVLLFLMLVHHLHNPDCSPENSLNGGSSCTMYTRVVLKKFGKVNF